MNTRNTQNGLIKKLIALCVVLLIFSVLLVCIHFWENSHSDYPENDGYEAYGLIKYNGKLYEKRYGITTVLVMGIDSFENNTEELSSYNNSNQADFLMLLIIDRDKKLCSAVHINRDPMADVTVLGIGGKVVGTVREQIALSHTYGSGFHDSCRNTVRAVSTRLFGVDIDHYISLTMDAVSKINDAVGGVEVELIDDFSAIDATMQKGKTLLLNGEQALLYVRMRAGLEDSTNLHRMERQRQYLDAFAPKMFDYLSSNGKNGEELMESLASDITTDFDLSQLDKMFSLVENYSIGEFYALDGEQTINENYIEFHVDDDSAKKLMIDLMYREH